MIPREPRALAIEASIGSRIWFAYNNTDSAWVANYRIQFTYAVEFQGVKLKCHHKNSDKRGAARTQV